MPVLPTFLVGSRKILQAFSSVYRILPLKDTESLLSKTPDACSDILGTFPTMVFSFADESPWIG